MSLDSRSDFVVSAQAKSEVALLERQKAAAVSALEASEDQLLELEREANSQLDELQAAFSHDLSSLRHCR